MPPSYGQLQSIGHRSRSHDGSSPKVHRSKTMYFQECVFNRSIPVAWHQDLSQCVFQWMRHFREVHGLPFASLLYLFCGLDLFQISRHAKKEKWLNTPHSHTCQVLCFACKDYGSTHKIKTGWANNTVFSIFELSIFFSIVIFIYFL